ncbi:hypothetical protein ACP3WW_24265, partial [Salmonella enterica]|uniref:hypothetical protein n=1 Tax=Salmonella enterica TaxID=28901 RepID=UPI003CFA6993
LISPARHAVTAPAGVFLDALLPDCRVTGGVAPKMGAEHLRIVSIRAFPARTTPGLLDALGELPFPLRWVCRWIA